MAAINILPTLYVRICSMWRRNHRSFLYFHLQHPTTIIIPPTFLSQLPLPSSRNRTNPGLIYLVRDHVQEEADGAQSSLPSPHLPLHDSRKTDNTNNNQIKNLAPLRSSDRRKIAEQIISDYNISVPTTPAGDASDPAASGPSSNLSTIRNALLPDNSQTARFTTTAGPDLKEVQGIVYVGAHPDGEDRVLWFKLEHGPGADRRLYPTVYTLWNNPNIIPLLYTPEIVMRKLHGGADLMTPGLANEPPFPPRAVKGAVVAVASVDRHTVPSFVGICEIDVSALGEVQGTKGHAVRGLHWEGDELWAWSSSPRPGRPAPEYLQGWDEEAGGVEEGVEGLTLEDQEEVPAANEQPAPAEEPVVEEKEPSTKGILKIAWSHTRR